MKAAENKRLVLVGIFVFLALVIFVVGVLTLGGQQKRFVKSIRIYAIFDNVEGLKTGNNIWFSGVKIGTVKHINFYGESEVEIEMNIEQESQQYIRKDAKARLSSESFIGNKIIEIVGGSMKAPMVNNGDTLAVQATLGTTEIMETAQANNRNLLSITNDIKTLTANLVEGQGTVGAMLTNDQLAKNFESIVANLQKVSAQTVQTSAALNQFTAKLNNKNGLVHDLLTDTSLYNQLRTTAELLNTTVASASELTANLSKASQKMDDKDNAIGMMLTDEEFARKLKSTMNNLETSTKKLDENMEALQKTFLLRGVFRREKNN